MSKPHNNYMSEKEAVKRYSYSKQWFENARRNMEGPPFKRIAGFPVYPISETDEWFRQKERGFNSY